jgi:CheY-like chemotaxis protein
MAARPRSVLLVDDSPEIRKILRQGFEAAGFSICAEAENGVEAIERAGEQAPDLIILDQSMPVMSGLQAAPELRRLLPATPIVLFTLYRDQVSLEHAAAAGISSVVAKPDIDTLIAESSSHLEADESGSDPGTGATGKSSPESKGIAAGSARGGTTT